MGDHLETITRAVIGSVEGGEVVLLIRLAVAAVLGAVLGWERESKGKAAGLRTHILVCIAAALYGGAATLYVAHWGDGQDGLRAVPAIATGIGFLGAGLIFVNRSGSQVQGLTTAASIWATAAIGMTVGFGFWFLSVGATILVFLTLCLVNWTARGESVEDAEPPQPITEPAKKASPPRP